MLAAPFQELPHKGSLLDLDGVPVLVHFDEEYVVRVGLWFDGRMDQSLVEV